jgi:metal transporter CNNM
MVALSFPLSASTNLDAVISNRIKDGEELGSPEFWWKICLSVFLVLLGGVFSG